MAMVLFPVLTFAGSVNLAWDAPVATTGVTITGYKIYYGIASRTYTSSVTLGNVLTGTVPNLNSGTTYFFTATALGTVSGTPAESAYSNEVSTTIPTQTFNIVASAGTGGVISPTGTTVINAGNSQAYTITANSGYKINSVLVDGTSVGSVATYTFSNVQASHTISATFTQIVVPPPSNIRIISASASGGGSISPSGQVTVVEGGDKTFSIRPNWFRKLVKLTVDGNDVPLTYHYTFHDVKDNHTISAQFASIWSRYESDRFPK